MATVQDILDIVGEVMLEPSRGGTAPGLSLGDVTTASFLEIVSNVIEEFILSTGLNYTIFTQQVNFGQGVYVTPNLMNDAKVCFVNGTFIDHTTLQSLDDWMYNWRTSQGMPDYWHEDGLAPKNLELAAIPNYSGASYQVPAPVSPSDQPPYGIFGLFNGATTGQFLGIVNTATLAVSWFSGATFDLNWNNYYPRPNIIIAGTVYPIDTVIDQYNLTVLLDSGIQNGVASRVNIGQDGNLTVVGSIGPNISIGYTLTTPIPASIPDSAVCYLAYGCLEKIFLNDSECKDLQRAAYCGARFQEGISVLAAVSGELLNVGK